MGDELCANIKAFLHDRLSLQMRKLFWTMLFLGTSMDARTLKSKKISVDMPWISDPLSYILLNKTNRKTTSCEQNILWLGCIKNSERMPHPKFQSLYFFKNIVLDWTCGRLGRATLQHPSVQVRNEFWVELISQLLLPGCALSITLPQHDPALDAHTESSLRSPKMRFLVGHPK